MEWLTRTIQFERAQTIHVNIIQTKTHLLISITTLARATRYLSVLCAMLAMLNNKQKVLFFVLLNRRWKYALQRPGGVFKNTLHTERKLLKLGASSSSPLLHCWDVLGFLFGGGVCVFFSVSFLFFEFFYVFLFVVTVILRKVIQKGSGWCNMCTAPRQLSHVDWLLGQRHYSPGGFLHVQSVCHSYQLHCTVIQS